MECLTLPRTVLNTRQTFPDSSFSHYFSCNNQTLDFPPREDVPVTLIGPKYHPNSFNHGFTTIDLQILFRGISF